MQLNYDILRKEFYDCLIMFYSASSVSLKSVQTEHDCKALFVAKQRFSLLRMSRPLSVTTELVMSASLLVHHLGPENLGLILVSGE